MTTELVLTTSLPVRLFGAEWLLLTLLSSFHILPSPGDSPLFDISQIKLDQYELEDTEEHPYRSRTHSRLLLRSYGWPIKHFLDLSELLYTLHNAVQGESV
jgi:hypothetical protein